MLTCEEHCIKKDQNNDNSSECERGYYLLHFIARLDANLAFEARAKAAALLFLASAFATFLCLLHVLLILIDLRQSFSI